MGEEQMDNVPLSTGQQPIPPLSDIPINEEKQETPPPTPESELARKLMGVFAVSSALGIFLWFMAGAGFPWFIYIVYAVSVIDCIIYAVKTKNPYFANWTIFATTNVMLFITYLACGGGYPWFIMPLCAMAIFPVSQYIWMHYQKPLRGLYIHAAIYLLINMMIFFIWVISSLSNPYPWFIYPFCGWGVLLLIHYNYAVMHDKSRLFVFICADLGIMLMITFRFAIGWSFMVFMLLALTAVVIYYLMIKKGYAARCWCLKRKDATLPQTVPSPEGAAQPQSQVPFNFALPQFHVQVQSPSGHQHFVPPPPGAVYFTAGQVPYPYQAAPAQYQAAPAPAPPGPGAYYAFYPQAPGLYPQVSPATSAPVPVPVQNNAIVANEVNNNNIQEGKEEEEETHLLRSSPSSRSSYSQPPSGQ